MTVEIKETLVVRNREEWRKWLAKHHADKKEIWLVYYRKASGKTGVTYDQSVEEALCYGWIDGIRRFTPRKSKSNWSDSNVERVRRLISTRKMAAPGLAILPAEVRKKIRA
ncbi:MAG: hypothetical protein E6I22_05055 [Chloroflexi bacterium]|nr:MAG: hypothetical protein E6I22_05055 [Chloroflexota bacterium]